MNLFSRFFLGCFRHEEGIKVLKGGKLHLECPRCQADLGPVLPKLKFKARKPEKRCRVVKIRKVS